MRILHWYPNFLGGGSVSNAVLGLSRAQSELGAEVVIASATPDGKPLYHAMEVGEKVGLIKWLPQWRIRLGSIVLRELPREVKRKFQEFNPNIVHVHGEFNAENLWVPRIFNAPIVLSPNGAFHPVVLRKSRRFGKWLYIKMASRLLYEQVAVFHALSPMECSHIERLVKDKAIYCVPQGPNLHVVAPNSKVNSITDKKNINFVFVGRLNIYTKGLDLLVYAFSEAIKRLRAKQVALTLVGPDWNGSMAKLQKMARSSGCSEAVKFTGELPGNRIGAILKDSDIYVHLSRHDAFPLAIAEALLQARPAILSNEIGTTSFDAIRSLPHVQVIPPDVESAASAMVAFAQRIEELGILAEKYLPIVRQFFSWRRTGALHLENYERICRGPSA